MLKITLIRILKSGWINFWRNKWLSVATISVMVLTIFVMTSLVIINVLGQTILENLQNKIDVSVYLKQPIEESEIAKIRSDLMFLDEVKSVEYISAEEALSKFKEKHQDNPILMQSLKELGVNPLQPSLNIRAQVASQYESIVKFLEQGKYKNLIDKINYQQNKELIERLLHFSSTVQRVGIIISLILALIAGLVTFNTIRLAMYNWREEISVMRLVGASDWYIRGPFLVEGMLYGVLAAFFTLIIFYPLLYFLSPKIISFIPGSDIFYWFKVNFWQVFLFQIIIGILLGGLSSLLAIRRYLKA